MTHDLAASGLRFGIEEEFFLLDASDLDIVRSAPAGFVAACRDTLGEHFAEEMFECQVEVASPVVSSDVGSCRELIEGADAEDRALGRAGEVVAIADPQATSRAILALLRNPQRWQAAQAVGLQRVERYYTEALMLGRYRGLYREATEIA
ncbi:GT4 family glycosyltransferase PelF [Pseudomonas aeruginosa]|nr:GT4 family glycosyltransferase PelF [Pseudomonas aeruginosa]